jgi:hypothetical protein
MYYEGFRRLMERCTPIDLGEPRIASVVEYSGARQCPCGRTSLRIHSITPTGAIHVSPCNANPSCVEGCSGYERLSSFGGECTTRGYLYELRNGSKRSMAAQDSYCPVKTYSGEPFPLNPKLTMSRGRSTWTTCLRGSATRNSLREFEADN